MTVAKILLLICGNYPIDSNSFENSLSFGIYVGELEMTE